MSQNYTLHLMFNSFDGLWRFYENVLEPSDLELFEGCTLDHEFSGAVPKNAIVVRHKSENRLLGGPLKAKVSKELFVKDNT